MNPTESLELISQMIRSSRRELARNSYRPFFIWGYTTVIVTLIELVLHLTATESTSPAFRIWVWWIIPIVGVTLTLLWRDRHQHTKSPLDINIGTVWGVLTIAMFTMILMMMIVGGATAYVILPMILLLMGSGTMITGEMAKLPAVKWGGFSSLVAAILICGMTFWFKNEIASATDNATRNHIIELYMSGQMVIFVLSFVGSMIIPGHYLKRLYNNPEHE